MQLARSQGAYTAISRAVFAAMVKVERILFLRGAYAASLRQVDIREFARQVIVMPPQVSKSGFVYRFSEADLETIRSLQLSVLVRCGNGILKGGVLSAARHGVLSMHHADNRVNRGGPAGFWEVLRREPQTGFVIQRLTEELDGGEILGRGSVSTGPFYSINQAVLHDRSTPYLRQAIRRVLDGTSVPEPPHIYCGPLYRTPQLHSILLYAFQSAMFIVWKIWRRLIGRKFGESRTFGMIGRTRSYFVQRSFPTPKAPSLPTLSSLLQNSSRA